MKRLKKGIRYSTKIIFSNEIQVSLIGVFNGKGVPINIPTKW